MTRLAAALSHLSVALGELQVPWALIGGLAVSSRVEPRMTRDVDAAVAAATDEEAERLVSDLGRHGFSPTGFVLEQEAVGRMATVRLVPPGETEAGIVVDLLFASSGLEPELVAEAELLEALPGVRVPVARVGHLIALKLLAARPLDLADATALAARADEAELRAARAAVASIHARGFDRGQDLARALAILLGDRRDPERRES